MKLMAKKKVNKMERELTENQKELQLGLQKL